MPTLIIVCKNQKTSKLRWTKIFLFFNNLKKKYFAVYDSDTPVTVKLDQGHKTWYELVDPKKGYNNAKFEKPPLNSVRERANDKVFCQMGKHINYLP